MALIILSSLTILWNCYYDLFTENMSAEYNRKVKLPVLPVYFLPVWRNLASFHQNKYGLCRSRKRHSQRLDSRSQPKINSGNWSLVVIQKFFLLKMNWSGELLSRQVGRTLPDGSLDIRHLIIILTKMRCCKWCYCNNQVTYVEWSVW